MRQDDLETADLIEEYEARAATERAEKSREHRDYYDRWLDTVAFRALESPTEHRRRLRRELMLTSWSWQAGPRPAA